MFIFMCLLCIRVYIYVCMTGLERDWRHVCVTRCIFACASMHLACIFTCDSMHVCVCVDASLMHLCVSILKPNPECPCSVSQWVSQTNRQGMQLLIRDTRKRREKPFTREAFYERSIGYEKVKITPK